MTEQLKEISAQQWQKVLDALGTGDFLAITFRPATEEERHLGPVNGIKRGPWWICEVTEPDSVTTETGAIISYSETTRKFPFRLWDLSDED